VFYRRVRGPSRQERSWTFWQRCPRTRASVRRWATSWRGPWRRSSDCCAVRRHPGRRRPTRRETPNRSVYATNSDSCVRLSYERIRQEIFISPQKKKFCSLPQDTRCCYSYNGQPIKSRTWSIERRHFRWPWTTPNSVLKVTPFFDAGYLTNE